MDAAPCLNIRAIYGTIFHLDEGHNKLNNFSIKKFDL
jgi:hypothetical protein